MWERHKHRKCIGDAVKHAEAVCANRKLRLTPTRKKVLELIWKSHKPIKAYDILAELSSDNFIEKPPTVYRALEFLLENNLIHRIESQNAYIGCNSNHESFDSKFFVCDTCHEVEELAEHRLNKTIVDICKKQGFKPNLVNIEIHGTCTQCAHS